MEVRDDIIGVVQGMVDTSVCEHDTSNTPHSEEEDKANRPEHRDREVDGPAPHGRDPREYLDTRRNGDHHRGRNEVGFQIHIHTNCVHVVCPHNEADHPDGDHGVGHTKVAEDRFLGEGRHDVADDAEGRQDHDVDFRVTKEPEQMLEHDRVTTTRRCEELRSEVTVGQQHGQRGSKHRQRQQQQDGRDEHAPSEQRHLVHGHARRAHVQNGHDEVDGAEDRRDTRRMQRQDEHIHCRAGMACGGRQRRIKHPAPSEPVAGSAWNRHRDTGKHKSCNCKPERDVVHAWEGHVWRADHQRNEPVSKATNERRHHHEEDHDQTMIGNHRIVEMLGILNGHVAFTGNELCHHPDTRLSKFPTNQARQRVPYNPRDQRKDQVQRTDVLVIGRKQPARKEAGLVIV